MQLLLLVALFSLSSAQFADFALPSLPVYEARAVGPRVHYERADDSYNSYDAHRAYDSYSAGARDYNSFYPGYEQAQFEPVELSPHVYRQLEALSLRGAYEEPKRREHSEYEEPKKEVGGLTVVEYVPKHQEKKPDLSIRADFKLGIESRPKPAFLRVKRGTDERGQEERAHFKAPQATFGFTPILDVAARRGKTARYFQTRNWRLDSAEPRFQTLYDNPENLRPADELPKAEILTKDDVKPTFNSEHTFNGRRPNVVLFVPKHQNTAQTQPLSANFEVRDNKQRGAGAWTADVITVDAKE